MSIVVPNVEELRILQQLFSVALTLKLYSNNHTPDASTILADLVEVTGGGYASKALASASWTFTEGSPSFALYSTQQIFQFTGATGAPGTIYGYYVVDGSGNLRWVERFPTANVPFTPIATSIIKIRPRYSLKSISGD